MPVDVANLSPLGDLACAQTLFRKDYMYMPSHPISTAFSLQSVSMLELML